MGCDIHILTEAKWPYESSWKNVDLYKRCNYSNRTEFEVVEIFEFRSYITFTMLAGVRNNHDICVPVFSEPREIPENVDNLTRREYETWIGDAHSASYATLKELKDWRETIKFKHTLVFDKLIRKMEERCDYLNRKEEDFRIVFWFDN